MAKDQLHNRSLHLTSGTHHGLYAAILSVLFIFCGSQSAAQTMSKTTATPIFKPRPIIAIEHVQPFQLERSFKFDWRHDRPDVRSGLLVVLKVDPDLVTPRDALEPVLYAGNQTVQRLNHGDESGYVIGIIPGQINLSQEPIWFGTPALPERIDTKTIEKERAIAKRSGIVALKSVDIQSRTRNVFVAPDLATLLREQAANLVLKYSPQEKKLADSWRLPVTGR